MLQSLSLYKKFSLLMLGLQRVFSCHRTFYFIRVERLWIILFSRRLTNISALCHPFYYFLFSLSVPFSCLMLSYTASSGLSNAVFISCLNNHFLFRSFTQYVTHPQVILTRKESNPYLLFLYTGFWCSLFHLWKSSGNTLCLD